MALRMVCFLVLFVCTSKMHAQGSDILRAEYMLMPRDASDIQVSRYRMLFNLPILIGSDTYLVTGAEYNKIVFTNLRAFPFDDSEIKNLHIVDLSLGYIFRWNSNWRFIGILGPRLASNFTNGIQAQDFKLNLTATLWKEKKDAAKPFRLILGLTYNSTTGLPVPLPLVSYYRRFHENWSYTLGIPRSSFKFYITPKHTIQTALFLDGYFANIQNDILLPDDVLGSAISLSAFVGVLGYQYNITKNTSLYTFGGYALNRKGLLRDDKRNNVYELSREGSMYFRTGIKISIF